MAIYTGTSAGNTYTGTASADTIAGRGGNDSLYGGNGNDRILGEDGNDWLFGGNGADSLVGGNGVDSLTGGAGNDSLFGGAGNDSLDGGTGNDSLQGLDGNDRLQGGNGNDSLSGGNAADTALGSVGNDRIDGGAGNDSLAGGDNADTLTGGAGNDSIDGGGGSDQLVLAGTRATYTFTDLGGGIYRVVDGNAAADGNDGSDRFTGIETVQFKDEKVGFSALLNTPPDAVNDITDVAENATVGGNVLGNDRDPDSDPLSVVAVNGQAARVGTTFTLASGAKLTLAADGTYTYDPNGAFDGLGNGDSDTDSFTYTISDGRGGTDTATVTVTIDGVGTTASDRVLFLAEDAVSDGLWQYADGNLVKVGASLGLTPSEYVVGDGTAWFYDNGALWSYDGSAVHEVKDSSGNSLSAFRLTTAGSHLYFLTNVGSDRVLWQADGTVATRVDMPASDPDSLYGAGSDLFFRATDNDEYSLWRYDGSAATRIDLTPGVVEDAFPDGYVGTASDLYFRYDTGDFYSEFHLGRYHDGTFAEIDLGVGSMSSMGDLTLLGSRLCFSGNGPDGQELWTYDGTTVREFDVLPGGDSSYPGDLTVVGSTLYFLAVDPDGQGIFAFNGTEFARVAALQSIGRPGNLYAAGGNLYFTAEPTSHGYSSLWVYDGTTASNVRTDTGALLSDIYDVRASGSTVYVSAMDDGVMNKLWRLDADGTAHAITLPGSGSSDPADFVAYGDKVYFSGEMAGDGSLWSWDGTSVTPIDFGPAGSTVDRMLAIGDDLFVARQGSDYSMWDLLRYDGSAFTEIDLDNDPDTLTWAEELTEFGGNLYFRGANDYYNALYRYDGTALTEYRIANPGYSSLPSELTVAGNRLYFRASDGGPDQDTELWFHDGTGLTKIDINENFSSSPAELTAVGSKLYFTASGGDGLGLWMIDGTSATPTAISLGPDEPNSPQDLVAAGTTLYFNATGGFGSQLYRYDEGSASAELANFPSGGPADGRPLVAVGSSLYFMASDGFRSELWRYDGSEAVHVLDGIPGYSDIADGDFATLGGSLFITSAGRAGGEVLWRVDGTAAAIVDLGGAVNPDELQAVGSNLWFSAADVAHGREAWVYDGTDAHRLDANTDGAYPGWPDSILPF